MGVCVRWTEGFPLGLQGTSVSSAVTLVNALKVESAGKQVSFGADGAEGLEGRNAMTLLAHVEDLVELLGSAADACIEALLRVLRHGLDELGDAGTHAHREHGRRETRAIAKHEHSLVHQTLRVRL